MEVKNEIEKSIKKLDDEFNKLISNNDLNINTIESLTLNEIEECKKIINSHIEELMSNKINEKELISKKNKNGIQGDIN